MANKRERDSATTQQPSVVISLGANRTTTTTTAAAGGTIPTQGSGKPRGLASDNNYGATL